MNGKLLTVDIVVGQPHCLSDLNHVSGLMYRLAECIGMTPMSPPAVQEVRQEGHEPGLTACLHIFESHVAIHTHTFTDRQYARVEVSSCVDFDERKVIETLQSQIPGSYVARCEYYPNWRLKWPGTATSQSSMESSSSFGCGL